MDFGDVYSKRLRMKRTLANEFSSCRQFLNGNVPENNDDLRDLVVNNAIERSMQSGLLKTLSGLCDNSRRNGANVPVNIKTDNWEALVILITRVKNWRRFDVGDLIEYCLEQYLEEIKLKGRLP